MINPQSGVALYVQLAGLLRDQILTGRLQPGQKLPSETTLQQEFGLARQTVRRAVGVLRSEGLVVMTRGVGALVREGAELQELRPSPGSTITARMPSPAERAEHHVDDGVPVFEVLAADGSSGIFPGDRWRLRWPQEG